MIRQKSATLDLATALYSGTKITASTITKKFGIKNPRRHIHYLRQSGVPVISKPLTRTINKRRFQIVEYSINT